MTKVLVTGACGFIGQNLVKKLNSLNYEVLCIDNFSTGYRNVIPNKVYNRDVSKLDLVEFYARYGSMNYPEYVFHLASPCSVIQYKQQPSLVEPTIQGFRNVINFCKDVGAKLIYPSSGNVYGNIPSPQKEGDKVKPNNLYAICKYVAENMVMESGIESQGFRIFAGYGPGELQKGNIASVITLFIRDMIWDGRPEIWGDGTQARDFVHIQDIVTYLTSTMYNNKYNGTVTNLGTGISTSFNRIIEIINDCLDKTIEPRYVYKPSDYVENTCASTKNLDTMIKGHRMIQLEDGIKRYIELLTNEN